MMILIWLLIIIGVRYSNTQLHVGTAINLFSRFGYLTISVRVIPRNDTDRSWIFREPTVDIFTNLSTEQSIKRSMTREEVFQGDFHMEFCDNPKQLLQAYFRDFSIERLDRPWKAFTASWSKTTTARNLGISSTYVNGEMCYVLVRVARHREIATLNNGNKFIPNDVVNKQIQDNVQLADASSVIEFARSFGTHYINSYTTGNSLYQVFVYDPDRYRLIKNKLKENGITELSNIELMSYFSPLYARYIGRVLSASGNNTVEEWARTKLQFQLQFLPLQFTSLLKLRTSPTLLYELDNLLTNEAVLKLDLKTLAPAFQDIEKKNWFQEVIDNNIRLWQANM